MNGLAIRERIEQKTQPKFSSHCWPIKCGIKTLGNEIKIAIEINPSKKRHSCFWGVAAVNSRFQTGHRPPTIDHRLSTTEYCAYATCSQVSNVSTRKKKEKNKRQQRFRKVLPTCQTN